MIIVYEGLPNAYTLNDRVDRFTRATRTRRAKREFRDNIERLAIRNPYFYQDCPIDPAELIITFYLADNRHRDLDNLMAGCKPWIDVLKDVGIIKEDDYHHLQRITLQAKHWGKPYVKMEINPILCA